MKTSDLLLLGLLGFGLFYLLKNRSTALQWSVNPVTGTLIPANVPDANLPALIGPLVSADLTTAPGSVAWVVNPSSGVLEPQYQSSSGGASGSW